MWLSTKLMNKSQYRDTHSEDTISNVLLPDCAIFSQWSVGTIAIRAQLGSLTLTFMLIFSTSWTLCSNLATLTRVAELVAVEATHWASGWEQTRPPSPLDSHPWSLSGGLECWRSETGCLWGPFQFPSLSPCGLQLHPVPAVPFGFPSTSCRTAHGSGWCHVMSSALCGWKRVLVYQRIGLE